MPEGPRACFQKKRGGRNRQDKQAAQHLICFCCLAGFRHAVKHALCMPQFCVAAFSFRTKRNKKKELSLRRQRAAAVDKRTHKNKTDAPSSIDCQSSSGVCVLSAGVRERERKESHIASSASATDSNSSTSLANKEKADNLGGTAGSSVY